MSVIAVTVFFSIVIVVSVVFDTIWVAIFRTMPSGTFKVLLDNSSSFRFTTNAGSFSVDHNSQMLNYSLQNRGSQVQQLNYSIQKNHGTVLLAAIQGIEYRAQVKQALWQELFFGLNLTDLLSRYRDTVEWFSITVVTLEGERIPLYVGGRYCPREFLMTWYIELQAALLERLGLLPDAETESREVLEVVQAHLGNVRLV